MDKKLLYYSLILSDDANYCMLTWFVSDAWENIWLITIQMHKYPIAQMHYYIIYDFKFSKYHSSNKFEINGHILRCQIYRQKSISSYLNQIYQKLSIILLLVKMQYEPIFHLFLWNVNSFILAFFVYKQLLESALLISYVDLI